MKVTLICWFDYPGEMAQLKKRIAHWQTKNDAIPAVKTPNYYSQIRYQKYPTVLPSIPQGERDVVMKLHDPRFNQNRPADDVGAGRRILGAVWAEEVMVSRRIFLFSAKFSNSYVSNNLHNSKFSHVAGKPPSRSEEHIKGD